MCTKMLQQVVNCSEWESRRETKRAAVVSLTVECCSEGQTQTLDTKRRTSHMGKQVWGLLKSGRKESVSNCKACRWLGGLRISFFNVKLLQRGVSMKNNGENGSSLCENYTRLKMDINLRHWSHQMVGSI